MGDIDRRTFLKYGTTAGVASLIGLAGCLGTGGGGGSTEKIKIGIVTDRSAGYSYLGTSVIRSIKLGLAQTLDADTTNIDKSNTISGDGITVELIIADAHLSPQAGRQKARKLVQKNNVDILQGSVSSSVALAVEDVAVASKTPMFVSTAAAMAITGKQCNKWTFRTSQTTYQDALAGGIYAAKNLGDSFYFIGADYTWGHDSIRQWKRVIERHDGKTLGESYPPVGTKSYIPYLRQAKDSGADCLVVALTGTDAITFTHDLVGFGANFNITATGVTTIPWMKQVGATATRFKGIPKYFWTFPENKTNDWIIKQYDEHWNTVPSIFTSSAHAIGSAVVQGVKQAGASEGEKLIQEWHGMTINKTARGVNAYTLRKCDHQAKFPMYLGHFEKKANSPLPTKPILNKTYPPEKGIRECSKVNCELVLE